MENVNTQYASTGATLALFADRMPAVRMAYPFMVQARLLALIASDEGRAADWRGSRDSLGWDTPMKPWERNARLILCLALRAIYHRRASLREEAVEEFLRILMGGDGIGDTPGARALNRARGWVISTTREGVALQLIGHIPEPGDA